MTYFSKSQKNISFFKLLYDDEILHQMYRYVTSIVLVEDEVPAFINRLKTLENVGLSFYLYYMDMLEKEDERRVCGFADFDIARQTEGSDIGIEESSFIDISDFNPKEMHNIFVKLFQQDGYFIVSDNLLSKDDFEKDVYNTLPERDKPDLKLIIT